MSFALTNPVALAAGKSPADLTRSDILNLLETRQIERLTFHYTALDGKLKELKIPVQNRLQTERILATGERVDGSSLFKGLVDTGVSDLYIIPDYRTAFFNPFDEHSLDFICRFLDKDGNRLSFAHDTVLFHAASRFKQVTGDDLYALGELEFYLLWDHDSALYPQVQQRGYHSSAPYAKSGDVLNEMLSCIASITGSVKYGHYEVGTIDKLVSLNPELNGKMAEQVEIEFLPAPIADMGDYLALSKWIIRNVAYKYGMLATFTPKLEEGVAGSGLHVHIARMRNGKNIMLDQHGKLSDEAKQLVAGLCDYADSITAVGNTVASSYLRLVPDQEAPTRVCWSDLNRSAMVRVPLGWSNTGDLSQKINPVQDKTFTDPEGRQTVELRTGDGSAYVYLLLAGIALACTSGAEEARSVEKAASLYVRGNIFENRDVWEKLTPLPRHCMESAKIFNQKRHLYESNGVFPASLIEYLIRQLEQENDANLARFLAGLAPEARLTETRRTLHKDIHLH